MDEKNVIDDVEEIIKDAKEVQEKSIGLIRLIKKLFNRVVKFIKKIFRKD